MKAVALALLALSTACWAQTYKCTEQGKSVYSDRPCGTTATKLNIGDSPEETERLRQAAIQRQEAQAAVAEAFEKARKEERDTPQKRQVERAAAAPANSPQDNCERLLKTAKDASNEAELYLTPRFKADAKRRQKEAEDEHFTKCYGTVKAR